MVVINSDIRGRGEIGVTQRGVQAAYSYYALSDSTQIEDVSIVEWDVVSEFRRWEHVCFGKLNIP